MGIPDYQKIMQHLLIYAIDEQEHSFRETIKALADKFNLSEIDSDYLTDE
jgi:restriction endonuclease Mrr